MDYLEKAWKKPDNGIWETRGPLRHFTASKVLAWVAFDRAIKSVEDLNHEGPADRWRRIRREIHEEVCRLGYDSGMNSFVQYYGSNQLDASLLLIPLVGFLPASDPRVQGTVKAIMDQLLHDGYVRRYDTEKSTDGLPTGEGAFLICTFWLADNLALQGKNEEAKEIFERLLGLRNDVGLLSEEYDPLTGRLLGNFPQAFSHVGLINTARNLSNKGGPAEDRGV
jgi:GH15 family glucan-1,4-alpha-glucosidase